MSDVVKNFAKCVVSGTYSSSDTAITLQAGEGAKLPQPSTDGAFNLVWWNYTDYPDPSGDPNKEIVRCTARTTDALTVTRNQESSGASTKNASGKTYMMMLSLTKKSYDDLLADSDLDTDGTLSANSDAKIATQKATKTYADTKLALAGGTMTGDIQLGETDIKLDATLSQDEKWSGIVIAGTLGATIAVGDLCYLNADDSRWELVDANVSDGYDKQLGICVLAGNDGDATEMLVYGKVRSAAFPAFTVGSPLYMSETAGDMTHTAPTTASACIRVLGFAITAEDLLFNPSNDYIIHT